MLDLAAPGALIAFHDQTVDNWFLCREVRQLRLYPRRFHPQNEDAQNSDPPVALFSRLLGFPTVLDVSCLLPLPSFLQNATPPIRIRGYGHSFSKAHFQE